MATITRVQHVQYDTADMLAVRGTGTTKFQKSGQPEFKVKNVSAVFDGRIRVTRLASGRGYVFLAVDAPRGSDRKHVFFQGDALVRLGSQTITVADYYAYLSAVETLRGLIGR